MREKKIRWNTVETKNVKKIMFYHFKLAKTNQMIEQFSNMLIQIPYGLLMHGLDKQHKSLSQ